MADKRSGGAREDGSRKGGNALTLATLTVVAAVAGVVLWLALDADETMQDLRVQADCRNLHAEFILPPVGAQGGKAEARPSGSGGTTALAAPRSQPAAAPLPAPSAEQVPQPVPPAVRGTGNDAPRKPAEAPTPVAEPKPATEPGSAERKRDDAQMAAVAAPRAPARSGIDSSVKPAEPDAALLENRPDGALPRIGANGQQPWRAYARPFDLSDRRPRIAIVVSDLGQSSAATETAIKGLPGPVTLAFAPYAPNLDRWLPQARAAGHESMLMVPMEPASYPNNDPGPHTLLTSLTPDANRERLEWVLGRATGYVGVVNTMGSRLTAAPEALGPVLKMLGGRGLMFLDARTTADSVAGKLSNTLNLPHAVNDRFIDDIASRDAIDLRLQELEALARERGHAVGIAYPYPVSFERLAAWIPTLEKKGIVLVPVTAIAAARMSPAG